MLTLEKRLLRNGLDASRRAARRSHRTVPDAARQSSRELPFQLASFVTLAAYTTARDSVVRGAHAPTRSGCACGGSCAKCQDEAHLESWMTQQAHRALLGAEEETEQLEEPPGVLRRLIDILGGSSHRPNRESGLQPRQGAGTIECDGSGGYRPNLGAWAGAACGIDGCIRQHEESHARDWAGRWPDGCKNADGSPKPAGAQIPLGGPGYADFLKQSECRAYTAEAQCEQNLLRGAGRGCRPSIRRVLEDTNRQRSSYCSNGC